MKTSVIVAILIGLIATMVVVGKIWTAEAQKNHPPPVCYVTGGHWNFWNGWECG